VLYTKYW